jgi:hypothetical protein
MRSKLELRSGLCSLSCIALVALAGCSSSSGSKGSEEDASHADSTADHAAPAQDAGRDAVTTDGADHDANAHDSASDAAAKDAEAKDGEAQDAVAKDAVAKDGEAKDAEFKDGEAKDGGAKDAEPTDAEPKDGGHRHDGAIDGAEDAPGDALAEGGDGATGETGPEDASVDAEAGAEDATLDGEAGLDATDAADAADASPIAAVPPYFMGRWDTSAASAETGVGAVAEWPGSGVLATFGAANPNSIAVMLTDVCNAGGCDSVTVELNGQPVTEALVGTINPQSPGSFLVTPVLTTGAAFTLVAGSDTLASVIILDSTTTPAVPTTGTNTIGVYKNTDAFYGGDITF